MRLIKFRFSLIFKKLYVLAFSLLALSGLSACVLVAHSDLQEFDTTESYSSSTTMQDAKALDNLTQTQADGTTEVSSTPSSQEGTSDKAVSTEAKASTKPSKTDPTSMKPTTTKAQTTTKTTTTKAPTTTKPSTPVLPSGDKGQMFACINQERTKKGLPPLIWDEKVANVAQRKAGEMVTLNYFGHTSPIYGDARNMLHRFGIYPNWAGENLAGNSCVDSAHTCWMNSDSHRKNMLNPNYTHVGIGIAPSPKFGYVYVTIFVSY